MSSGWYLGGVAEVLPFELKVELDRLDPDLEKLTEELRFRIGQPMSVNVEGDEIDVADITVTSEHLMTILENVTQASAHTVLNQVKDGFITAKGGHRIGMCGTTVCRGGEVANLRCITSLSVRIAKACYGIAEPIIPELMEKGTLCNTLIIAPPGTGKTTMLRDMVRTISDGGRRVSLVDERGEIAAVWQETPQFEIGRRTDVLNYCPKAIGMLMMLRGMNPQVIAVDEITHPADVRAMTEICGCGVTVVATAHGTDLGDLRDRPLYCDLLERRIFKRVVVMGRTGKKRSAKVVVPG